MPLGSSELYELFLALAPSRIDAARDALDQPDAEKRAAELTAALVPLVVDAALLGAEGVSELGRAVVDCVDAPRAELDGALDALESAAVQLGQHDESGARVDESELRARAERLRAGGASATPGAAPPPAPAAPPPEESEDDDESRWVPELAEDMVAAFLDECVERLDGLSERLMLLEERGQDQELVGEIFRDLHTLKGSSAFAGLKKMNRVAHLAEDRIGELRDGRKSSDRALIDVLLETLDVLRAIVERARARQPIDIDVRPILARLADPSAPVAAPQAKPAAAAAPAGAAAPGRAPARAGVAAPRAASPVTTSQGTLRIDFGKVDQLMNLVGETVLARGRLAAAAEVQGALLREVAQLRKKFAVAVGSDVREPAAAAKHGTGALVDELQRTERVLTETYGDLDSGLGSLGLAVGQLRDTVMKLRMVPIARLFTKYQRTVRELSHKLGKEVHVELVGAETELDKVLVERLEDPLLHLVRNSVDHGIESPDDREAAGKPRTGLVRLSAGQRGGQILVTIEDDGAGMDPARLRAKAIEKGILTEPEAEAMSEAESLQLIFRAGFSTAQQISDVSGRGVGMDVVRDTIQKLKGSIHLDSTPGHGTTMELRLPLTLAITQVLAARVGGELVAIPLDAVVSAQAIDTGQLEAVADGACLRIGEQLVPVVDLGQTLRLGQEVALGDVQSAAVIIVDAGTDRLGLLVQQVLGRHEVVIKSLGPLLAEAPCAAGATLIGDRVLLVVDLSEVAALSREPGKARELVPGSQPRAKTRARILIAEDSEVIRETIKRELTKAGFDVVAAADGREALELARGGTFDAVSTDVMMPVMDGYELTRALRREPRYREVPIVMVTSKDARIDTLRGFDAGADAYLTKPSDAGELIRTIDALLSRR